MAYRTKCRIIRIQRADGVQFGATDLDRNLTIDNLVYRAAHAVQPEAVEKDIEIAGNTLSIQSILEAEGVTHADLLGRKFDGANVVYAKVDYRNLPSDILLADEILLSGRVGQIKKTDTKYTLEIKSLTSLLNQQVSVKGSPSCRHEFSDPSTCFSEGSVTRDLSGLTFSGFVASVSSLPRKRFNFNLIVPISLQFGQVEFTSGKNTGFIATIGSHAAGSQTIELINAVPFSIAPNDTVIVKAGCNKSQGNCNAYENFINFGALPFPENNDSGYMPGNDELLAPSTR